MPPVENAASWWVPAVSRPLALAERPVELRVDEALVATLQHSPYVKALSDKALVRKYAVDEASARFDLRSFLDTRFTDTSDPVGNTLTTGGARRFIDQNWNMTSGLRRLTSRGGQLEASQRIGYQDNNSIFFLPKDQGTAKLSLTFTQPLLQGAGKNYQTAVIVLADVDAGIARDQLSRDLQGLMFDVHRMYWDLYAQRAALLQRRKLWRDAVEILEEIEARRDVDVVKGQVVRAKAAVARREAATYRFAASARNATARLLTMVADPELGSPLAIEFVPMDLPRTDPPTVDLLQSIDAALQYRPEIQQGLKEIHSASIKAGVARNEMLPVLNLVMGSYVSALNGEAAIGQSLGDQFAIGRPTYWAGVQFDRPLGNRAAIAHMKQREIELRQLTNQLAATTAQIRTEVTVAVREVEATWQEVYSKEREIGAAQSEIEYLTERWRLLSGEGQAAGSLLDDLLAAQERLGSAENEFVVAQAAYHVAQGQLLRVTGQLITAQELAACKVETPTAPALKAPMISPPTSGTAPAVVTRLPATPPPSQPPAPAPRPSQPQPRPPAPVPARQPTAPPRADDLRYPLP